MKIGDLVMWSQGHCDIPGLVLETKPSNRLRKNNCAYSSHGTAILAMFTELGNDPEWFHECELEIVGGN
tara:strand:- start:324 stop:530 length:207 start_codon:yes stop_codon:yes gene_type:complete